MMRSMFAGVSGLRSHQTKMDVVGNNIANVNTAGFKRSTVTFSETLNQQIRGASAPTTAFFGGTNPMQVGLGVGIGSMDVVHSAGSPQATGRSLDMSIEGEGYFIVGIGADNNFTRAGNFGFDSQNNLVAANGMKVKGWTASLDANNAFNLDTGQPISGINLTDLATTQIMQATTEAAIALNLDSRSPIIEDTKTYTSPTATGTSLADAENNPVVINIGEGVVFDEDFSITAGTNTITYQNLIDNPNDWSLDPASGRLTISGVLGDFADVTSTDPVEVNYTNSQYQTSMKIYDNQGGSHDFAVTYVKTDANEWSATYAIDGDVIAAGPGGSYTRPIVFKPNGQIEESSAEFEIAHDFPDDSGLDPLNIKVDLNNMIQVANDNSTLSLLQNGFEPGSLQRVSVNQTGQVIGTFSNGENLELAQVAIATFSNNSGLNKVGETLFTESRNSGTPEIGSPGSGGRGNVKPESLEMSNVDLSQEFVDMIITQRGFQANSRIITTSDELLQELVNLKR